MRAQTNIEKLIDQNKKDLLNDKEALIAIEQKIDEKYSKQF
ncbi:FbpB family small basic protein [Lentibacillus juripiscarius]|uniref:FbpB family small basic protein n=1 Tax=Lentibacillus juripiscarius TaxID=257446 RepID=A0ABW5V2D4_9BACI